MGGKLMATCAAALCVASSWGGTWAERLNALFAIDGKDNVIAPEDCGLVNGHVTFNGWLEDVAEVRGFIAPPYQSRDFSFVMRFNGMPVRTESNRWRPEELWRTGHSREWKVTSRLLPVADARAAILEVEVENTANWKANLNVRCNVSGGLDILGEWKFGKPGLPKIADVRFEDWIAVLENPDADVQLAASFPGGVKELDFKSKEKGWKTRFHVAIAIGRKGEALELVRRIRAAPAATVEAARAAWTKRVGGLSAKFPALETDNAQLERLYARSLLHLLLNEWNVPEFELHPYYATGGINGGCVGNYLWNYGEVYRLWPMLSSDVAKSHLRKFLSLDLTKCFAFDPCSGKPFGPYYPVNQEKVLLSAYAYVLETGDRAFLSERLGDGTVLDRLQDAALALDDLSKPAVLVDYGDGNHHLELRKEWRYDGVLPDMNLRRIVCFRLADRLCALAGARPRADYVARANALKKLVKDELWDANAGWFAVVQPNGKRELRWTMQMFKALGWGDWAIPPSVENALVGHLMDEKEFLGPYGVHSLAKTDPAYDEDDVDNGGPGACVSFAPAIVDRLYRSGRVAEAEKIFRRLWWLADCLPYWGDSHYADRRDYRRDTPLMNDIQGASLAQTVIFGLFGIEPKEDRSLEVTPHLPKGTKWMALRGVRLAGRTFDVIATEARGVEVLCEGRRFRAYNGESVVIPPPAEPGKRMAGDNLMPNGDFEAGEAGWKILGPSARIERGGGFEGSAGFVFEKPAGPDVKWPQSEGFPVEGGVAYRIEARMNTDAFENGGLSFSLAASDANGKVVAGCGTTRITDNDPRTDGWYRVEGVTKALPLEAKTASFYLWSRDESHGTARIDDIVVKPAVANPLDKMVCSAYRAEAAGGDVTFKAAYVVNPDRYPDAALRTTVEYLSVNGFRRARAETRDGVVSATVPVSDFAFGRNAVRFRLYVAKGWQELGTTTCFFTRLAKEPSRKVTFDGYGRAVVDGRLFFPLGMFWGKVTEEKLNHYCQGPFNCLMPYSETRVEALDLCAKRGLKVLYHLSGQFKEIDAATPEKAVAISDREFIREAIRLKDHPAIFAWYIADEVPAQFAPILRERCERLHEVDPDHPTWVVLDQPANTRPLVHGYDAIGVDPYPIGNRGNETRTAIGIASGWALTAKRLTFGFRPMWNVPQTFNWKHYRTKDEAKLIPNLRWPTEEEFRTMTWQQIAAGANGIVYYSYFDIVDANRGWSEELKAQKWREVVKVAEEVKAKERVLLSEPGPAVERAPEGIVARTWRTDDGTVHVLVCNALREAVSGDLVVGGKTLPVSLPGIGVEFKSY